MDELRSDALSKILTTVSRRAALGSALGFGASTIALAGNSGRARKKKKKKLKCPAGQDKCGNVCCSPDRQCTSGACQCRTPCGKVCCPNGMGCLDVNTSTCGCDDTVCSALGCDCDTTVGSFDLCIAFGSVDCEDLQACSSIFDCPVGEVCRVNAGCDTPICGPLCFP